MARFDSTLAALSGLGLGAGFIYFFDPVSGRSRKILADQIFHEGPVDDRVLEERVRARLGRHTSHAAVIEVSAVEGVVTLRGPILLSEMERVLRAAGRVPGVDAVVSELEPHETAGEPWELGRESWSPRILAGTVGSGLAVYGAQRRDAVGVVAAAAGLGLLLRAVTNGKRDPATDEIPADDVTP